MDTALAPADLIPFRADSSLFIDPVGLSMYVITPAGKVGRVASIPRSQDAGSLASTANGLPGHGRDRTTRLPRRNQSATRNERRDDGRADARQSRGGSAQHVDRKLDTAGFVKMPKSKSPSRRLAAE